MLLRFGVSNFRSIRDYAEVSLIASDGIKDQGPDLMAWEGSRLKVLPGLVLYGANAAGKSSIFSVMTAMRSHVVKSFVARDATGKIPRPYFRLDAQSAKQPTRFDCDFVLDNVRYHFGFEFDGTQFLREWLYSFPEGHRRVLYNRDHEEPQIEFGKFLKGRNKSIEDLNRPNSLFLSAAAQGAHPQLTPIYSYFRDQISGLGAAVNNQRVQERISSQRDPRLIPFLQLADTGISGLTIKEGEIDERLKRLYASIASTVATEMGQDELAFDPLPPHKQVTFSHTGSNGELYQLPFSNESRGTRRISELVLQAFSTLDSGGVLFIDELDASLHTLLSLKLLSLFMSEKTNPKGAQIVAITHDTNILCSESLRRDQIWFAEKDGVGQTQVYPLTDIQTRNTDNLEKGYLQGRYGAIPFLGRIEDVLETGSGAA